MTKLFQKTAALLLAASMAVPSSLSVLAEGSSIEPVSSASPNAAEETAVTATAEGLTDGYELDAELITDSTQIESIQSFLDDRKIVRAYEINPVNAEFTDPEKGAEITLTFSKDEVPDADAIKTAGLYHLIDYTLTSAESTDSTETNTVSPDAKSVNVNASYEKLEYTYDENTGELKFKTKSFSPFVLAEMTETELKQNGQTEVKKKPNLIARIVSLISSSTKKEKAAQQTETASSQASSAKPENTASAGSESSADSIDPDTETSAQAENDVLSADADQPSYSVKLQNFSAGLVGGASKNSSGEYVWAADNSDAGHGYMYQVNYQTSGSGMIPAGAIQITIPKQMLKDRDENYADEYEMSLPINTASGLTDENSFVYKEDGDNLVIYNRIAVEAAQNGNFQIIYKTSKKTFEYSDYGSGTLSDTFKASIKIDDISKNAEAPASNMDTSAVISGQSVPSMPQRYESWQDEWGEKPADADKYIYLDWTVRSYINNPTQYYDFTISADDKNGEVVGYKYSGESTFTAQHTLTKQTENYSYGRYDHILTRLDKNDYGSTDPAKPNYTIYLKIMGTVVPEDSKDEANTQSVSGRYYYERPKFYISSGQFQSAKYGRDYRNIGPDNGYYGQNYDSEAFRVFGDAVKPFLSGDSKTLGTFRYHVYTSGYPGKWTVKTGEDDSDPGNYWKQPVVFNLYDENLYYGTGNDYTSRHNAMMEDDYNFVSLDFKFSVNNASYDTESKKFKYSNSDLSADDAVSFYAKKASDSDYVLIGKYSPSTGVWSSVNSDYVSNAAGMHIDFADGIKMYKISAESAHYFTCIDTYPEVVLNGTDALKSYINANQYRFAIRNRMRSDVTCNGTIINEAKVDDNSSFDQADAILEGADYGTVQTTVSSFDKSIESYHNDTVSKTAEATWNLAFSEQYAATGTPVLQSSGKFYDLLPKGADYKPDSAVVYSDDGTKLNSSDYTVSVDSDWKNSGRTMLIVSINKSADKYEMTYTSSSSWDALKDYGKNILNTAAYETGNNDIGDGYPDDGSASAGTGDHPASQKITEQALMSDLDNSASAYDSSGNKRNKFVYAQKSSSLLVAMAANLGLYKKVKSNLENGYSSSAMVKTGEGYFYKIRFATDANTTASDMIIYDAIEQYKTKNGRSSDWHGILQGINTDALKAMGADPVIYYSTTVTDVSGETDTLDASKWSTDAPADMSTVTAIAVDIRKKTDGTDFVMDPNTAVSMYLYMKAPNEDSSGSADPTAYNNIYMYNTVKSYTSDPSTGMIHQNNTSVKLRVMGDVDIVKVKAGDHSTAVSGMEFNLSGTSDYGTAVNMTQTTSSNGELSFKNVEKGSYILQETKTDNDWLLNTNRYTVRIDGSGNAVIDGLTEENGRYVVENTPRIHGDLKIRKSDAIKPVIGLEGAEFKLEGTSSYGTSILMYTESSAGGYTLFKNVEMGTYTLTETKAPEGYVLNRAANIWKAVCDENGAFTIYDGDTALEAKNNFIRITNEPLHRFTILKVPSVRYSEDDPTALAGAEFELSGTSSYGTSVDMKETTGRSGMLTFKGLEPGVYVLKETKAPEGYHKREDSWAVVVKADDTVGIDGLKDDGNGNWIVVDEKIPTDKVVITKHWKDGLTGKAADSRPYPNIVIASFDQNEAINVPVEVKFKDGAASADVTVTLKRNGDEVSTITIDKSVLKGVFTNQPKYDDSGAEYKYTLEASVSGNYMAPEISGGSSRFAVTIKSLLIGDKEIATIAMQKAQEAYKEYAALHSTVPYNTGSSYRTATFTYFADADDGIFNFHYTGGNRWVVDSNRFASTEIDPSKWTDSTVLSDGKQLGQNFGRIWTVHMDPATGKIVRIYAAFPGPTDAAYLKVVNAIKSGNKAVYEQK